MAMQTTKLQGGGRGVHESGGRRRSSSRGGSRRSSGQFLGTSPSKRASPPQGRVTPYKAHGGSSPAAQVAQGTVMYLNDIVSMRSMPVVDHKYGGGGVAAASGANQIDAENVRRGSSGGGGRARSRVSGSSGGGREAMGGWVGGKGDAVLHASNV